jgi:hypothetical protein
VKHLWGKIRLPAQRYEHREGYHCQVADDPEVDSSGWTAGALRVMMRLSGSMAYERAEELVRDFGLLAEMSRAGLERLTQRYAAACQEQTRELLELAQEADLAEGAGRKMVLEVDGVRVLGQPEGGSCQGMEIKTAVLYPMTSPSDRSVIADRCEAQRFTAEVAGLLREAGLRRNDELVAVSDGAEWIKQLLSNLGIETAILDVYHSSSYLDTVMQALGWDVARREQTRRAWLRGEIKAAQWLSSHLPEPETWLSWDEPAQTALRYLEERQQQMDYPAYKQAGNPIASGQIEGINKSYIGYRMKQSGMQWSPQGAGRMAALRAWRCSKLPLVSHHTIRHAAFPCPIG